MFLKKVIKNMIFKGLMKVSNFRKVLLFLIIELKKRIKKILKKD